VNHSLNHTLIYSNAQIPPSLPAGIGRVEMTKAPLIAEMNSQKVEAIMFRTPMVTNLTHKTISILIAFQNVSSLIKPNGYF
jgi:hypothetical protein